MKFDHFIGKIAAGSVITFTAIIALSAAFYSFMTDASAFADAVSATANVVMAWAAVYAAATWRNQINYKAAHDFKADLISALDDYYDLLQFTRNELIMDAEFGDHPVETDQTMRRIKVAIIRSDSLFDATQKLLKMEKKAGRIISESVGRDIRSICHNTIRLKFKLNDAKDDLERLIKLGEISYIGKCELIDERFALEDRIFHSESSIYYDSERIYKRLILELSTVQ